MKTRETLVTWISHVSCNGLSVSYQIHHVQQMSGRSAQNTQRRRGSSRQNPDCAYHDRIDLADDFETIHAREGRFEQSSNLVTTTGRLPQRGTVWTVGNSWEPEDNVELSLDPSSAWYDEVVDAPVTIEDPASIRGSKKKRSVVSVSNFAS